MLAEGALSIAKTRKRETDACLLAVCWECGPIQNDATYDELGGIEVHQQTQLETRQAQVGPDLREMDIVWP